MHVIENALVEETQLTDKIAQDNIWHDDKAIFLKYWFINNRDRSGRIQFLLDLGHLVRHKSCQNFTRLTICHLDGYGFDEPADVPAHFPADAPADDTQSRKIKKEKKEKKYIYSFFASRINEKIECQVLPIGEYLGLDT